MSARAGRRRRVALRVLAALALALVGGALVLGWLVRGERAGEDARQEALDVARGAAVDLLSYDYRRMDEAVEQGAAVATGDFLEEYRTATSGLAEQARAGQVVVTTTVEEASVSSARREQVEVLLFVDQTTRRTGLQQPRTEQNRLLLTLQRVDGAWRVSALDAL